MKNRRCYIIGTALLVIVIVILLPLAMDKFIIGNDYPSNVSNEDWVTFFGSYFGGIIGAVASMCGIILTIHFSSKQNQEDHVLRLRPYCIINYSGMYNKKLLGRIKLEYDRNDPDNTNFRKCFIEIKNIGLGPAIEINVEISYEGIDNTQIPISFNKDKSLFVMPYTLLVGEEGAIEIILEYSLKLITSDDFIETISSKGVKEYTLNEQAKKRYSDFDIIITLKYNDLLDHQYLQNVVLSVSFKPNYDPDPCIRSGRYNCVLSLKKVTNPTRVK